MNIIYWSKSNERALENGFALCYPLYFQILQNVYKDIIEAFYPSTVILKSESWREKNNFEPSGQKTLGARLPMSYMRGDEVNFDCWEKEHNIIDWLKKNGYPFAPQHDQEGYVKL